MRKAFILAKDTGGANYVRSILPYLAKMDVRYDLLADKGSRATIIFEEKGLSYVAVENVATVQQHMATSDGLYNPLIISTHCSQVGLDMIKFLNAERCVPLSTQSILLCDYFVPRRIWRDAKNRPDIFVVPHSIGARRMIEQWHVSDCSIRVCGQPIFAEDVLREACYDTTEEGLLEEFKRQGLDESLPTVLVALQLKGSGRFAQMVVDALNQGRAVNVILRPHPNIEHPDFVDEFEGIEMAIKDFKNGHLIDSSSVKSAEELLHLASTVLAAYSTLLMQAVVYGIRPVSFMPTWYQRDLEDKTGYLERIPSIAQLGWALFAENTDDLVAQIARSVEGDIFDFDVPLRELSVETAAYRVAEVIAMAALYPPY